MSLAKFVESLGPELMTLFTIDRNNLRDLHPLLNRSAGYEVSLEDELEYFDPDAAKNWAVATADDGRRLGFIRSFRQSGDWSLGELFVEPDCEDRLLVAKAMLDHFKIRSRFDHGHRLRFDLWLKDSDLNEAVAASGFSEKTQIYFYFERAITTSNEKYAPQHPTVAQIPEIIATLSFLHSVTEAEVSNWIRADQIRVIGIGSRIVCAAHIRESDNAIEISRIATHADFLRNGYATKLISQIAEETVAKKKSRLYLKVEETKVAAIATYRKSGLEMDESKTEKWHSSWPNA